MALFFLRGLILCFLSLGNREDTSMLQLPSQRRFLLEALASTGSCRGQNRFPLLAVSLSILFLMVPIVPMVLILCHGSHVSPFNTFRMLLLSEIPSKVIDVEPTNRGNILKMGDARPEQRSNSLQRIPTISQLSLFLCSSKAVSFFCHP